MQSGVKMMSYLEEKSKTHTYVSILHIKTECVIKLYKV